MNKYDAFNNGGDEHGLTFLLGVNIFMVVIAGLYFTIQLFAG